MRKTAFKNLPKLQLRRYRKLTLQKAQAQAQVLEMMAHRRKWYGQAGVWRWGQHWRGEDGGA